MLEVFFTEEHFEKKNKYLLRNCCLGETTETLKTICIFFLPILLNFTAYSQQSVSITSTQINSYWKQMTHINTNYNWTFSGVFAKPSFVHFQIQTLAFYVHQSVECNNVSVLVHERGGKEWRQAWRRSLRSDWLQPNGAVTKRAGLAEVGEVPRLLCTFQLQIRAQRREINTVHKPWDVRKMEEDHECVRARDRKLI